MDAVGKRESFRARLAKRLSVKRGHNSGSIQLFVDFVIFLLKLLFLNDGNISHPTRQVIRTRGKKKMREENNITATAPVFL